MAANGAKSQPSYQSLDPHRILAAVESAGYRCDGHLLALNSYENRVYQVGIEDQQPLIAKFYRPGRWSEAAILEEHGFVLELVAQELPVVPPLMDAEGRTLHFFDDFRFALYSRQGGRSPELDNLDNLAWLGRFLGRIHAVGAITRFTHRPALTIEHFGEDSYQYLLEQAFIPHELTHAYRSLAEDLLKQIRGCYARAVAVRYIRLHGDCHPGNILWTTQGPHFVDFDDCCMGPAIQDLWMLLAGERHDMTLQIDVILTAYTQYCEFDGRELHLIEALRTLRMMHYAAWLARRWQDPAFKKAFPWFNTTHYWQDHILSLREQAALMDEPPLSWQ